MGSINPAIELTEFWIRFKSQLRSTASALLRTNQLLWEVNVCGHFQRVCSFHFQNHWELNLRRPIQEFETQDGFNKFPLYWKHLYVDRNQCQSVRFNHNSKDNPTMRVRVWVSMHELKNHVNACFFMDAKKSMGVWFRFNLDAQI